MSKYVVRKFLNEELGESIDIGTFDLLMYAELFLGICEKKFPCNRFEILFVEEVSRFIERKEC